MRLVYTQLHLIVLMGHMPMLSIDLIIVNDSGYVLSFSLSVPAYQKQQITLYYTADMVFCTL